jgi:hypothetical protein
MCLSAKKRDIQSASSFYKVFKICVLLQTSVTFSLLTAIKAQDLHPFINRCDPRAARKGTRSA